MCRVVVYLTCFLIAQPVAALLIQKDNAEAAFQNIIDTASYLTGHTGISLGVALPANTGQFGANLAKDRVINVATGWKHFANMKSLGTDDKLPIGSATKLLTATAAMKLVEDGKIHLDDLALPHMDVLFHKVTAKSFRDYFGPHMANVTVRDLLHMTSGLGNFDSRAAIDSLYSNPSTNEDGFSLENLLGETLKLANIERAQQGKAKGYEDSFTCMPGKCGEYSSTNYVLVGMMLAQSSGVQHWLDYDQSSFLPQNLRVQMRSTIFPLRGRYSEFTDVHGYQSYEEKETHRHRLIDTHDHNCNIGWTTSNAMSSGKDMAVFLKALLGQDSTLLKNTTRQEMLKLRWLESGDTTSSAGQFYGMGLRDMSAMLYENPLKAMVNPEIYTAGLLIGDDGVSPGGYYSFSAYSPTNDFAFSFILNNVDSTKMAPFLTKKIYDLASSMTTPVQAPLTVTYENKELFYKQKMYKQVKQFRWLQPGLV